MGKQTPLSASASAYRYLTPSSSNSGLRAEPVAPSIKFEGQFEGEVMVLLVNAAEPGRLPRRAKPKSPRLHPSRQPPASVNTRGRESRETAWPNGLLG